MTDQSKTPPAATGGVLSTYSIAGKQTDHKSEAAFAQAPPPLNEGPRFAIEDDLAIVEPTEATAIKLLPPPGLVGHFAEYIYHSALYPMKEAALFAALGLMAGIVGRCYNYKESGLNLYLLLLAPTGRGKEDMARGISRLLFSVRSQLPTVDDCLGPGTFASGQALLREIAKNPVFLSIQSEFGLTLKNLNDPRATAADRMLRQVMLDVYGKSGRFSTLRGRSYSDGGKDLPDVHSPCVTIVGESTPGHVFDSLSFRDVEDGLLPRCLILECNDQRPRKNRRAGDLPPQMVMDALATLVPLAQMHRHNSNVVDVIASNDAAVLLQDISDKLDDAYNDMNAPAERALWNRAALNINRLAALVAVGCDPHRPTIEASHVQWAASLVYRCVGALSAKFRAGVVGTGEGRQEGELRRLITEYVKMQPEKRRATYKVPATLCMNGGCIGVDYLRRRARQISVFNDDRRGLNMALDSALRALTKSGFLVKLSEKEAHDAFGLTSDIYALGKG